jgi:hypothetical protein|tara:strand:+ start:1377 stop:1559 length:183 start_codon:yes stop_codon:yes gene_type:complete
MKFEQAVQKSIKSFLKGDMPEKLMEMKEGGLMYTPEFFDDMQENYKSAEAQPPEETEVDV